MAGFQFTDAHILQDLKRLRDSTNLVVASKLFRDRRRFEAFSVLYAAMREIDDLVDSVVEEIPDQQKKDRIGANVRKWEHIIKQAYTDDDVHDRDIEYFRNIFRAFPVPKILWDNFFSAMWQDFNGLNLQTYEDFLTYAEGASVAATTIYLMLIGGIKQKNGTYSIDNFDYIKVGRDLGIWAYTVHILRDLKEDVLTGLSGRFLIPKDLVLAHGLTEDYLRECAKSNYMDKKLERLFSDFHRRGEVRGLNGKIAACELAELVPAHRQSVLCLIIAVYSEISRRIQSANYNVTGTELLYPAQERELLVRKIMKLKKWPEMVNLWHLPDRS